MKILFLIFKIIFLLTVSISTSFGNENMNDNFNSSPEKRWVFFADTVMGGRSSGKVTFANSYNYNYAHLSGFVTTENNGGFIQIRKKISGLSNLIERINFKVKGNNEVYHVFLRTTGSILPWHYYKAEFKVTNKWKKISIPISIFQRSSSLLSKNIKPNTIKSIGLVAFGRDFEADLFISELEFK